MTRYSPKRESRSEFVPIRGLSYHVRIWEPNLGRRAEPAVESPVQAGGRSASAEPAFTVFMVHGWMDVSASFQFLVDHLPDHWRIIAPDWRGFGLTDWPGQMASGTGYWQPDYLADLDALLDRYSPDRPVRLVGHSMGANASTLYAGVRPHRIDRLVNLEGIGLPRYDPSQATTRMTQWLDELKAGPRFMTYPSHAAVAARLMKTNPRLRADFAEFLAPHWSRPVAPDPASADTGPRYELLGDPLHRLTNPILYRVDEVDATWRAITAPVLFVLSEHLNEWHHFVTTDEYERRLTNYARLTRATIAGAGHMMHHDQPEALATLIEGFLS